MATSQMSEAIQHLRRAVLPRDGVGLTDGQLLAAYLSGRDEAALAALVRRHGPMVWGVCRRVLRNWHDAEDAFQATFLVLVRKAASLASPELLANWLYGVAYQTALKARATTAKRKTRERQVTQMPESAVTEQDLWDDLLPLFDQELSRLPDKYRAVIVLCDLQGKTRKDAAQQLGCPEGTVAGWLARARAMLAKRLAQRGVTLSGGALAAVLAHQAASAGVPYAVVNATIKAATLFAAGHGAATGMISVKVAALTEGVLKTMLIAKVKTVVGMLLAVAVIAFGAGLLCYGTAAGQQGDAKKNSATAPPIQDGNPKSAHAKGKPTNDKERLQGEWQAVEVESRGEKAPAELSKKFRILFKGEGIVLTTPQEASKGAFKIDSRKSPKQIDISALDGPLAGKTVAGIYSLDKGKLTICLPDAAKTPDQRPQEFKTGEGNGQFLLKLRRKTATGRDEKKPTAEKPVGPAAKQKKEKEARTAWGKEVGGVQAGLGFRPGEHRAYHTGETVTLVVRVRNVSKKEVKFVYAPEHFYDDPPVVTDGAGKPVSFQGVLFSGEIQLKEVTLAPGKEVDLCGLTVALRPASEKANARPGCLYETGKFHFQYERVGGNIGTGEIEFDPILSKLTTGRLELEVKDSEPEKEDKKPFTAWGKEIGGLQAGLGFRPGEKRAYHYEETLILVIRVRNVSQETVKFSYLMPYIEHEPIVTNGDGKRVPQPTEARLYEIGERIPGVVELAPGKEIELHELKRELKPASESGSKRSRPEGHPHPFYGTGKVSVQYEHVFGSPALGHPGWKLDPTLSGLDTGKLQVEVKDAEKLPE
jgi:RNA polymerase sigma factor (sigma-70 family)